MKFACDKITLVDAVGNVQRAVSGKTSIPALEGLLLKVSSTSLFLAGYDMEVGITTLIEADVQEPGDIILNARQLGDMVRRLPGERIAFETEDNCNVKISSGTAVFHVVGIAAAEYPELPTVDGGVGVTVPQQILKSMIRQTLFAVAPLDGGRPVHTGTLFEVNQDTLRLVSVDGSRLAIRNEAIKNSEELRFVVPGKTLGELLKLLSEEEKPVFMAVGKRHIIWQVDGYAVISRLLDGEFLAYQKAIPQTVSATVKVRTRELTDAVERVSLVISDRIKSPLICRIEEGVIHLSCATPLGSASDEVAVQMEGEAEEIGFNSRFLLDALKNTETDEITLELGGAVSPMKVLPAAGDTFLFLVLPVRIKK